jgi:hypothetical protein
MIKSKVIICCSDFCLDKKPRGEMQNKMGAVFYHLSKKEDNNEDGK